MNQTRQSRGAFALRAGKVFVVIAVLIALQSPCIAADPQGVQAAVSISTCEELQAMKDDLDGDYVLANDIDCSETASWNGGLGFEPIGDVYTSDPLDGSLDGGGHTVFGLTIERPSEEYVGLLRFAGPDAVIRDLRLEGVSVHGKAWVGGLVGYSHGAVIGCATTGSVTATSNGVGGLVGLSTATGQVSTSHSLAAVSGTPYSVGGLVGRNRGSVSQSYAGGIVRGEDETGGLVGTNYGAISRCFSTADVWGGEGSIGGLVGYNLDLNTPALISDSYAAGRVDGSSPSSAFAKVGGLLGLNSGPGSETVANCFSVGRVTGHPLVGGLVGLNLNSADKIAGSYWDTESSGDTTSDGGTGKTTAEMRQQATFAGWDFYNTWSIYEGMSYPWHKYGPMPDLHVVGLASGKLWHTLRHPYGWEPFQDIEGLVGEAGWFTSVAAASLGNELHVVGGNGYGELWHTVRHSDGSWEPWVDVEDYTGDMPEFEDLAAAAVNGKLHLVAVGGGGVWHTIRRSSTDWDPFGNVESQAGEKGTFTSVAAASIGGDLHVVGGTSEGGLWHTIRHPGWWTSFGNVEAQAGDQGTYVSVAAASAGEDVHVVGVTTTGGLWHTIRHPTSWEPFSDVEGLAGEIGSSQVVGGATVAGSLHLTVGTTTGGIRHTLRLGTTWQPFGNVEGQAGEVPTLSGVAAAHTVSQRYMQVFLPLVLR